MIKILVIEDQPQMRKNICVILEMENFHAISADNGRAGLEMIRRERPDLVLCDVTMPVMDGQEVLEELRASPVTATLPFIFLTANSEKTDVRRGMNLGADDYLTKPVAREDLLAAVKTRLARNHAHQAELSAAQSSGGFNPDFSSAHPLRELGLTEREAEVLLWVTQGKANADVGVLLGMAEKTVKKHMGNIFEKLGVENRNAASLIALEKLGSAPRPLT
jgi:DNA-binding NarL/FixJ family response regulator